MAGVALRRLIAEHKHQVIAVRADQRGATINLIAAATGQFRKKCRFKDLRRDRLLPGQFLHCAVQRGGIAYRRCARFRRHRRIRRMHLRCQLISQLHPASDHLGAQASQLQVPCVESAQRTSARIIAVAPAQGHIGIAQQRITLPQYLVIIRLCPTETWRSDGSQAIQKAASFCWLPRHESEILRRKHHGPQHPKDLPRGLQPCSVNLGLVRLARTDQQMRCQLAALIDRGCGNSGIRSTGPHERHIRGHTVTSQRGGVNHRFHDVGFAVAIPPRKHRDSRLERQRQLRP